MRRVFVHLHIPKCGGSTIVDILSRNFGPGLVNTNSILNDYQYDSVQVARIIDHYPRLRCLTGHKLSLDLPFDRKDFDLQVFTWIRDPIDRFVSHYFYHRNHTNQVPEAKTMDLLEYTEWALKYENQGMYINGQTKFLGGGSLEKIESMVTDGQLIIFPLTKLQESLYTLEHRFPDAFPVVRIKNRNISKKDQELPDGFRDLVTPFVEKDMYLMKLARQTKLEVERPSRNRMVSGNKSSGMLAWKVARFLRRAAYYVESRFQLPH